MDIKEVANRDAWDTFVASVPDFTFLQSWNWGEFHRARGERVWRFGAYDDGQLIGCMQVVSVTARRGSFLFVPHGPLTVRENIAVVLPFFATKLIELGGELKYGFIRISPWIEATEANTSLFHRFGFRSAPSHMHAEETWLLPLISDEAVLLKEMRKTTRNLISRAEREGVVITASVEMKDVRVLLDLQAKTAARHKFVPFSDAYLKKEFEIFSRDHQALLFLGKYNGVISSAAIIIFFGHRAFYFQSGSTKSDAPVSYLLQWEVIKEAKRRGCTLYNLWGVAPEDKPHHEWTGLTTFKSGFGGYRKNYMHAQDLPLSNRYWISWFIERLPRTFRAALRFGS